MGLFALLPTFCKSLVRLAFSMKMYTQKYIQLEYREGPHYWVQLHPQILRKTDFALTDFEEI